MASIKSLLVAIDFREEDANLCKDAVVFAQKLGADVTFVYAVDYVPYYPYFPYDEEKVHEDFINEITQRMDKMKVVFESQGVKVSQTVVDHGKPWQVICEVADKINANAIIVGVGRHFLFDSLIGSVTERVCHMAKQAVIVIHPSKNGKLERLLCSYDFCENSERALTQAIVMADTLKVPLDVIHVMQSKSRIFEKVSEADLSKMAEDAGKSIYRLVNEKTKNYSLEVNVHVRSGDTVDCISKFIENNNIDLLFIGSSGHASVIRLFLGSTTQKLLHASKCSIIVSHKCDSKLGS